MFWTSFWDVLGLVLSCSFIHGGCHLASFVITPLKAEKTNLCSFFKVKLKEMQLFLKLKVLVISAKRQFIRHLPYCTKVSLILRLIFQ